MRESFCPRKSCFWVCAIILEEKRWRLFPKEHGERRSETRLSNHHLAARLRAACPALREDAVAHSREHSLEVELPFLQLLDPGFSFVPIAIGTLRYDDLRETGEGLARTFEESSEDILIVTSSDMNHYEDDETTRQKDRKAIDCMLNLDPKALFEVCRNEEISMCGLGPAIVMLTAMNQLGVRKAELVRYRHLGRRQRKPAGSGRLRRHDFRVAVATFLVVAGQKQTARDRLREPF